MLPIATCCTIAILLLHAIQFAICCRILCSLLRILLPHVVQFATVFVALFVATICYHMLYSCCYLLPHAMQFATCCLMPYSCWFLLHTLQLLFVAACCAAAICCCMPCSLVFVADCCTVCYLLAHAMQLAICCCTLYSLPFIAIPTAQHNLGEIGHSKNCLIISNTNNCNSLLDKVHCHKEARTAIYLNH